jgi:hypothetical protein
MLYSVEVIRYDVRSEMELSNAWDRVDGVGYRFQVYGNRFGEVGKQRDFKGLEIRGFANVVSNLCC